MSMMMKKQVAPAAVSRRSTVVVQARRTVSKPNKNSTPDSLVRVPRTAGYALAPVDQQHMQLLRTFDHTASCALAALLSGIFVCHS